MSEKISLDSSEYSCLFLGFCGLFFYLSYFNFVRVNVVYWYNRPDGFIVSHFIKINRCQNQESV